MGHSHTQTLTHRAYKNQGLVVLNQRDDVSVRTLLDPDVPPRRREVVCILVFGVPRPRVAPLDELLECLPGFTLHVVLAPGRCPGAAPAAALPLFTLALRLPAVVRNAHRNTAILTSRRLAASSQIAGVTKQVA